MRKSLLPRLLALLGALSVLPGGRAAEDVSSFAGYTRPGAPNDVRKEGAVVFIADDPVKKKEAVGGSIYYIVLQRPEKGDWDADVKAMVAKFRPGVDSSGGSSGGLDLSARYLYLFQMVNDRGTLLPIQASALNLQVDLKNRAITSWGSFPTFGFGAGKMTEPEKPAGPILPVSSTHRDVGGPAELLYRSPSPFVPATQPYRIKRIATKGEKPPAPGPGVAKIEWDPVDPAIEPDHVMLVVGAEKQSPAFRAVWTGDALQKGNRSTLYGFTSNLPPTYDAVRIQGPGGTGLGTRPAAEVGREPEAGGKVIVAEGQAPTPRPEGKAKKAEEAPRAEGPPLPPLPVAPLELFIPDPGMPGGSGTTQASFGSAGGASGSGGGSAASSGSAQQSAQQQQQQQQGTLTDLLQQLRLTVQQQVTQNMTNNQSQQNTQTQSQSQSQSQSQQQQQSQAQQQNQGLGQANCPCQPKMEVVPEPATFVAAALALSFLVVRLRGRVSEGRVGACTPRG